MAAIVALSLFLCPRLYAVSYGTCGDDIQWESDDTGVLIIRGSGAMTDYSLDNPAPWGKGITHVTITGDITNIGESAFRESAGLAEITMPSTITTIGTCAFDGCSSLKEITIGDAVTSIGSFAFYKCVNLEKVVCEAVVPPTCGNDVFYSVDKQEKCVLYVKPTSREKYRDADTWRYFASIKNIERYCGDDLTWAVDEEGNLVIEGTGKMYDYTLDNPAPWGKEIKTVKLPEGITYISSHAFYEAESLTEITIPSAVTSIGDYAFYKCSGFKRIVCEPVEPPTCSYVSIYGINKSACILNVKDVAYAKYRHTDPWNNFVLIEPLSANYCGDKLFWTLDEEGCLHIYGSGKMYDYSLTNPAPWGTDVKSIELPETITSIGSYAFVGCTGLTNVSVPAAVSSIGEYAFYGCSGLTDVNLIDTDMTTINRYTFCGCNSLANVNLPNELTEIGACAFYGCAALTMFTFPSEVATVGTSAFESCAGLTEVTIPASLISFGTSAFKGCDKLSQVNIGNLAAWCGIDFANAEANPLNYAHRLFLYVDEIKDLVVPDGITEVKKFAFVGGSDITSITIPTGVTAIGESAFDGCSAAQSIAIPSTLKTVGTSAFRGTDALNRVDISDLAAWCDIDFDDFAANPTASASHLYLNGEEIKSLVIPAGVSTIKKYAFYNCSELTGVTVPTSVLVFGDKAFYGCSGLTRVDMSDLAAWCNIIFYSIEGYTSNPLYYANHLYLNGEEVKDLVVPSGVKSIKDATFYNCTGLTSVKMNDMVGTVDYYAFAGCTNLTNVVIGHNVYLIMDGAFRDCENLKDLTLGASVQEILFGAFYGCKKIERIISLAVTPPSIPNVFETVVMDNCNVFVPKESLAKYLNNWIYFKHISADTGVNDIDADNSVSVRVDGGNIEVDGATADTTMEVYSMSGVKIYSGIAKTLAVPSAGVYLVRIAGTTVKVTIR